MVCRSKQAAQSTNKVIYVYAAARDLIDANENVTILEARDRIGGRVHTDRSFAGLPVEFGAEFIHGDLAPT